MNDLKNVSTFIFIDEEEKTYFKVEHDVLNANDGNEIIIYLNNYMKDDVQMAQPPQPPYQPKEQVEIKKRQQSEFDNKLMNYFSEEFFKRKLEIAPKRNPMEPDLISEDYDKISSNAKLFRYLQQIEKEIDNKIFKSRLDLQEKLVIPSQKVKALLRTHICSYLLYESNDLGEIKTYFQMRIQGKIMPVLDHLPGGTYHKFTHYFQKIIIKFSSSNENKYQDIEWTNPNLSSYNHISLSAFILSAKANLLSLGIDLII